MTRDTRVTPRPIDRRRFRRLPTDVQECLRGSGGLHHHRLDHVEAALAHVGVAGTLAWIGNGLPPCSRAEGSTVMTRFPEPSDAALVARVLARLPEPHRADWSKLSDEARALRLQQWNALDELTRSRLCGYLPVEPVDPERFDAGLAGMARRASRRLAKGWATRGYRRRCC